MVEPEGRAFRARLLRVALVFGIALTGHALGDSREEAQLEGVRKRIDRLQRTLNETVGKRDTARDELQAQERRINDLMRSLRETDARLVRETRAFAELKRREQRERETQRAHLAALESQIRAAHALGRQPYLKMLLNQESPAVAARAHAYYRYFNEARVARINDAQARLVRLHALENEVREHARALADLRRTQDRERQALEESRRRRTELLARLDRQVANQTQEIERLRADQQRLERLMRELKAVFPEADVPAPGPHERFAALKGRLPLPVTGTITARYGQPKGVGNLTWRGIFLAGKEGQNVHAISRGRVAFADWLRGFGLLLILDHGDGYMTLYGHNETLHRRAGDWVEAGQAIAVVGNTGDAPETGVYFEVRHNGVPQDPLQWCAIERAGPARAQR